MPLAPIELNLYNVDDEIIGTLSRSRIPSYLLDMAIDLQNSMTADTEKPNSDVLFDFIVEFYGHKVEREDLKQQTDLVECMAVLQSIMTRATQLMAENARQNPQVPSPKRK